MIINNTKTKQSLVTAIKKTKKKHKSLSMYKVYFLLSG